MLLVCNGENCLLIAVHYIAIFGRIATRNTLSSISFLPRLTIVFTKSPNESTEAGIDQCYGWAVR